MACASIVGWAGGGWAEAQVILRDARGEVKGRVGEISAAGVSVAVVAGATPAPEARIVGWDRVRTVEADARGAEYASLSDALWRARTRLERGDWLAAETALESVRDASSLSGPTGAVAHEGLLRCRLARGARSGAVTSWLALLRVYEGAGRGTLGPDGLVRPVAWIGGVIEGPPVVDARTGLAPALPPVWLGEPAMEIAAAGDEWRRAGGAVSAELAGWYAAAAAHEGGTPAAWPGGVPAASPDGGLEGLRLVRLIVQARTGDASQRAAARDGLGGYLARETLEGWEEAWCRAGIGRSLLREEDRESKIRGVVQLLHAPARLGGASAHLAAVCLADAAAALWELGDTAGAAALKAELLRHHPAHPAASWRGVQAIPDRADPPERGGEPAPEPGTAAPAPGRGGRG